DRGPAIVTAFLRGHETPEVRVMGDTGRALGGGDISAFEGSCSQDDIQYRVRSIIGAAGIDASAVAVSLGTGVDSGLRMASVTSGPSVAGPSSSSPSAPASDSKQSGSGGSKGSAKS